jgi:hypothetical protein
MCDKLRLWRANHTRLRPGKNPNAVNLGDYHQTVESEAHVKNAVIVNGDNVDTYGLFCKHFVKDQLIWNGNNGSVIFYQCKLPYDVKDENSSLKNFMGYKVSYHVESHKGLGIGVYCNFTKEPVTVKTAITLF